jgi:hypothetical protein
MCGYLPSARQRAEGGCDTRETTSLLSTQQVFDVLASLETLALDGD